jgi:hypothetical protein
MRRQVKAATERAVVEATGRPGQVICRCTHVYPDGPAPYFTFHAAGRFFQVRCEKSLAGGSFFLVRISLMLFSRKKRERNQWSCADVVDGQA